MSSTIKVIAGVLVLLAVLLGAFAVRLLMQEPAPQPAAQPVAVAAVQDAPAEPVVQKAEKPMRPVVVAARALKPGVPLKDEDLRLDMWPVMPSQGFSELEALQGETLKEPLLAGEPVTQRLLALGLARHLDEGERAVSIALSEAAVGMTPGDKVDVFFTLKRDNENQNTQARLLLPSARILALGNDSLDGPINEEDTSSRGRQSVAARTAMLAVPLKEVNSLLLAMDKGKLQLALRSPEDSGQPDLALFAERTPVLQERTGLSRDDKERLKEAENLAFAGDSMASLSASDTDEVSVKNKQRNTAGKTEAARSVQVIRGRQSGLQHY